MALTPISKQNFRNQNSSGIALFMVLASVALLSVLVTEFTYLAQISQSIAYGGLDQTKAHYLAKSALKLSLLRLKMYKQVKESDLKKTIPKGIMEKIWSFPIPIPLPNKIPGMLPSAQESIEKFNKESNLEGNSNSIISSESCKYNLNQILPGAIPSTLPSPGPSAGPSPTPFNAEDARKNLQSFIGEILDQKFKTDLDFASNYRDFRIEDLIDQIEAWTKRGYDRRTSSSHDQVPMKQAPFYSLSELHFLPSMDDELYDLLAPQLTTSVTTGFNVNTIDAQTLKALVPQMTQDEVSEFIKYRDSDENHLFPTDQEFFDYLQKKVGSFQSNPQNLNDFKNNLKTQNMLILTEENSFKITVQAQVNQSIRTLQAWVLLDPQKSNDNNQAKDDSKTTLKTDSKPNSGLKITFMNIL